MSLFDCLQEVAPRKAKLKIAEAEYNGTVALLEEKRSELRTLESQLAELHQKLQEANEQKEELEDNVSVCSNKLMRAEKLIGKVTGSRLLSPELICMKVKEESHNRPVVACSRRFRLPDLMTFGT